MPLPTAFVFASSSTLITFILLLVLVRWIGSTQLTQLTFFNWVAGASMGNIAANMISTTNSSAWLLNAYTLILFTLCSVAAAWIALKSRPFRLATNGQPVVLIHRGSILRSNMKAAKVNVDILLMMLREKGYFEYSAIEYAILEPTGNLSILPSQAIQSATKKDLVEGPDLSDKGQGPYTPIIIDGEVDMKRLRYRGLTMDWVTKKVAELGVTSISDVILLGVSREGELIVDIHYQRHASATANFEV